MSGPKSKIHKRLFGFNSSKRFTKPLETGYEHSRHITGEIPRLGPSSRKATHTEAGDIAPHAQIYKRTTGSKIRRALQTALQHKRYRMTLRGGEGGNRENIEKQTTQF